MAPQHFLIVAFPTQGHINPARALAERLLRAMPGARVTLSAAVSAHRLMFPSLASPDEEVQDGAISYVPYSDGYDRGFHLFANDGDEARRYCEAFSRVGRESRCKRDAPRKPAYAPYLPQWLRSIPRRSRV